MVEFGGDVSREKPHYPAWVGTYDKSRLNRRMFLKRAVAAAVAAPVGATLAAKYGGLVLDTAFGSIDDKTIKLSKEIQQQGIPPPDENKRGEPINNE